MGLEIEEFELIHLSSGSFHANWERLYILDTFAEFLARDCYLHQHCSFLKFTDSHRICSLLGSDSQQFQFWFIDFDFLDGSGHH